MIENLLQDLLEQMQNRYFGKYRGYVHDVTDPLKMGRIRAVVPRLLAEEPTGWAMPCSPYAGPDQGLFTVPDVGAGVWMEFEGGDLSRPIWTGAWWGMPGDADRNQPDSTARWPAPGTADGLEPEPWTGEPRSEVPRHATPMETAEPGVRVWKSSTGHIIVLDDRTTDGHEPRLEIRDSSGNRVVLTASGLDELLHNQRTVVSGRRTTDIGEDDDLLVGGGRTANVFGPVNETIGGDRTTTILGNVTETVGKTRYTRKIDHTGVTETVGAGLTETIRGGHRTTVAGAATHTASGGYAINTTGPLNLVAGGGLNIAVGPPAIPPALNAISFDALVGNVSLNTKLGIMQLGGPTAISPVVIGDGLLIHLTMMSAMMAPVNPLTVAGYGLAFGTWATLTPLMSWSNFLYAKRLPVG